MYLTLRQRRRTDDEAREAVEGVVRLSLLASAMTRSADAWREGAKALRVFAVFVSAEAAPSAARL